MKNTVLDKVIYSCFGVFLFVFFAQNVGTKNIFVELTFILIGIISYSWFILEKELISINKMISAFCLLFFSMAPLIQYQRGVTFWQIEGFNDSSYLFANFLILLFLGIYMFAYYFLLRKMKTKKEHLKIPVLRQSTVLTFLLISFLSLLFLIVTNNLISADGGTSDLSNSSLISSILKIIKFIPVACLILVFYSYKNKRAIISKYLYYFSFLVLFIISLIIFNPVSGTMGRYLVLAVYLILFSLIFEKEKHKSILLIAFLFGFVVLFPTLNFFKYHSILEISKFELSSIDLCFNDYDAYFMLMSTIRYTDLGNFQYGLNIVSSIFSIIPRSIWSWKSETSGSIVALGSGASFLNVSCPIIGEFYFAFGLVGVMLLTSLSAYLVRLFSTRKGKSVLCFGINAILTGMSIPILRGSMLPMFSFLTGMILSFLCCYSIQKVFSTVKEKNIKTNTSLVKNNQGIKNVG